MHVYKTRTDSEPPKIPYGIIRDALAPYRKVPDIRIDSWFKAYRYAVSKGIRQVPVLMTQHATYHLIFAGYRVQLSYDGQPATCYGCGKVGHMFQDCPVQQGPIRARTQTRPASYAAVLAIATPAAQTNTQNNPEINDLTIQRREESESREVSCAPTCQTGSDDQENGAPRHMSQPSPQSTEHESGYFASTEGTDDNVLDKHDNMETEEPQAAHTYKEDKNSYKRGKATGRRLSIPPPEDLSTQRDNEEQRMGLT